MAFTSSLVGTSTWGAKSVRWGTFTNSGGSSGGDIDTHLTLLEGMSLQYTGASAVADDPAINEVFPIRATEPSATVEATIVTTANASGIWRAWGV